MTIRSAVLLALLMSAGFLGNYFAIPLFFGADFLFGSIAVLLVLYFYGLGWGLLAALVAYSYTWVLWGHPYGCINFMSEALFVGLFLKWRRRNLVVLDSLFWLFLGMSMVWIEHGYILQMDSISTIFIMLKQAINGIFNALLVSLAIYYLPLGKLFQRPHFSTEFSLRDSLFSLLVMLVLLPALLLTMLETRKEKENLEANVVADLQSLSANLQFHLQSWFQQHVQAVHELAGLAGISSMTPAAPLQHETEILKQAFPNFHALHVENAVGRTIAFSPKVNEKGESTIGYDFSDRSWFKEAKAKQQLVVSEVFRGRAAIFSPILVFTLPIMRENHWLGTATGTLDLGMVQKILKPYSLEKTTVITLTDSQGKIIASTAPERPPMQFWDRKKTGVSLPLKEQMYHWYPDDPKLPSMTRWKQSFYVQEISLGPELPWKLTVEVPVALLQHTLFTIYVKNLTIMAILTALTLLFSLLLSRWLTRPLVQLSHVTANLPENLSEAQNLDWPASSALEINALIANSKSMAHTLEENFHNLQAQSDELRQVNQDLNREIQERQRAEEKLGRSLSLQNATLESTYDGLLVVDRDRRISSYNKKFAQMWRIPEAILASKKDEAALTFVLQQLKTPEIFLAKVQELYGEPEAESYEVIEFKDGRIFERLSQPQRLGEEVVGRVWSFRDVTRQRQAEGALRDNEQFLTDIFNSIQDGLSILDQDLNILRVNPAMEKFGYTQPMVGRKCYEVYHNRNVPCEVCPVQQTLRTGKASREIVIEHSAIDRFMEIYAFPLVNPATGQVDRVIEYVRDITERKQAEQERLRLGKLESLGVLAGGIAHDFNNILTAIIGNISLSMLDLEMKGQARERLTEAERACQQAQNLSRQLLTFSKGGAPIKKIVSLKELATESASFACRGSRVNYQASLPDDLWAAEADPGQISQVLHNLVINAIQAMPSGGMVRILGENLVVEAGNELGIDAGRYVKISIQDEGIGISADHLSKIFDPYFTTKQMGSGLGLATSYSIIKNHRGHISVESKLEKGSTFHVYLPASDQKVTQQLKEDGELISGKGKILIMDDEPMVREVLGKMLLTMGYEVESAQDGAKALELYTRAQDTGDPFVTVILDLTVPGGMGGKEVIARLLKIDPQVKAIVSSGYSDDPVMANFQSYGFTDVIAKPYRILELDKVLKKTLPGWK